MGLVQDFGAGVGKALWPLVEPKLDQFKDQALALGAAQLQAFQEKALALMPVMVATAVKFALEEAFDKIPGVEVPPLNVENLTGLVRGDLNQLPDVDIKGLSDIFDLTEFVAGLGINLGKFGR